MSIPDLTAARHLPVVAMVSAFSPSSPTLFGFSMLLGSFSISSVVKEVFISAGVRILKMFSYYVG